MSCLLCSFLCARYLHAMSLCSLSVCSPSLSVCESCLFKLDFSPQSPHATCLFKDRAIGGALHHFLAEHTSLLGSQHPPCLGFCENHSATKTPNGLIWESKREGKVAPWQFRASADRASEAEGPPLQQSRASDTKPLVLARVQLLPARWGSW